MLSIPSRIRRVAPLKHSEAYYPLEEAYTRNLVLEPLKELDEKRGIKYKQVIWLKGLTCPNDILENLNVSFTNDAAMACGTDWAEWEGAFEFSDWWRTRDIEDDQFRQTSSKSEIVPPRGHRAIARYGKHIPFQIFCCEAGTHVVDSHQSYYKGIYYRSGTDFFNASRSMELHAEGMGMEGEMGASEWEPTPRIRGPNEPCLDSSQAWFCRNLWVGSVADEPLREGHQMRKREVDEVASNDRMMDGAMEEKAKRQEQPALPPPPAAAGGEERKVEETVDLDDDAGSDYDAMPAEDGGEEVLVADTTLTTPPRPNSAFEPATCDDVCCCQSYPTSPRPARRSGR